MPEAVGSVKATKDEQTDAPQARLTGKLFVRAKVILKTQETIFLYLKVVNKKRKDEE
jgi:hypothetical protein